MLNGLLQPTQRLARLPALEEHPTHAVQERRVFRLESHRLADQLFGLVEVLPAFGPHVTEIIEGLGEFRRQLEALAEVFFRFREGAVAFEGGAGMKIEQMREA